MRLIDADEFVKTMCNSCDGACDKVDCDCLNCHEDCRCEFARWLDDFPAEKVIPLSAIEKIKAEIGDLDFDFGDFYDHTTKIREMVIEVIDQTIKECDTDDKS